MIRSADFRKSDGAIIFGYVIVPIGFVFGVAFGLASNVPWAISALGLVTTFVTSICSWCLPIWTVVHIVRSRGRTGVGVLYLESVLTALWICYWFGAFLSDKQVSSTRMSLILALVALCIALTPLVRRPAMPKPKSDAPSR